MCIRDSTHTHTFIKWVDSQVKTSLFVLIQHLLNLLPKGINILTENANIFNVTNSVHNFNGFCQQGQHTELQMSQQVNLVFSIINKSPSNFNLLFHISIESLENSLLIYSVYLNQNLKYFILKTFY